MQTTGAEGLPGDFGRPVGVPVARRKRQPRLPGPPHHCPRARLDLVALEHQTHRALDGPRRGRASRRARSRCSRSGSGGGARPGGPCSGARPSAAGRASATRLRSSCPSGRGAACRRCRRDRNRLLVNHRDLGQSAQRQEPPPVVGAARGARPPPRRWLPLCRAPRRGPSARNRCGLPCWRRSALVLVDHFNGPGRPPQRRSTIDEGVLASGRLAVLHHLRGGRLSDVHDRSPRQIRPGDLAPHRAPRSPLGPAR